MLSKWRHLGFLMRSLRICGHYPLSILWRLKITIKGRCCSSKPRVERRRCPTSWQRSTVSEWGEWSSASRPSRTPMSAWWEAAHECQSPDQILAHHIGRCRNDSASANDRWFHYFYGPLSTNHHCCAWIVDAERQRRRRRDVRCCR